MFILALPVVKKTIEAKISIDARDKTPIHRLCELSRLNFKRPLLGIRFLNNLNFLKTEDRGTDGFEIPLHIFSDSSPLFQSRPDCQILVSSLTGRLLFWMIFMFLPNVGGITSPIFLETAPITWNSPVLSEEAVSSAIFSSPSSYMTFPSSSTFVPNGASSSSSLRSF